jgi:hypothetical protein
MKWTRTNAVLKAEQLPAGVTNLDTSLTDVDGDDLTHVCRCLPTAKATREWTTGGQKGRKRWAKRSARCKTWQRNKRIRDKKKLFLFFILYLWF